MREEPDELDIALENFVIEQLQSGPKSAKEMKKAIKSRLREIWWRLVDRNEVEITQDNKLKLNANRTSGGAGNNNSCAGVNMRS